MSAEINSGKEIKIIKAMLITNKINRKNSANLCLSAKKIKKPKKPHNKKHDRWESRIGKRGEHFN